MGEPRHGSEVYEVCKVRGEVEVISRTILNSTRIKMAQRAVRGPAGARDSA
jgi:hypothetical protein